MSAVVKKKVKKLLSGASGRVSQQQIVTSLQQLNNLDLGESGERERERERGTRNAKTFHLQRTVEERQVLITERVVAASEELIADLSKLDQQVSALNQICERIEASVHVARSEALPMLAERERLLAEQRKTNAQAQVLTAFNELFNLKEEELLALNNTISPHFFKALSRVQTVHANCRMLLRSNHRRAGLELMDRMSNLQEKAYENLCRWVQSECNSNANASSGSEQERGVSNALLKQAIESLKSRPVLLKYCAEEVAGARHNVFFRRFLDALTKSQGPTTPAIETFLEREPVAYVRKIFLWLTQNIEKEKVLFSSLFATEHAEGDTAASISSTHTNASSVQMLLDRVFEGICRPLKVRLEQVLMSNARLKKTQTYQICQTLEHHAGQLGGVIGEEAALTITVRECLGTAVQKFEQEMKQSYNKLMASVKPASFSSGGELAPPEAFVAELDTLSGIVRSPALPEGAAHSNVGQSTSSALEEVLEKSVKLLCDFCEKSASHVMKAESEGFFLNQEPSPQLFPRGSHQMYLINCLQLLLKTLQQRKPNPSAPGKSSIESYVASFIERNMGSLVSIIVQGVMHERDLAEKIERIRMYEDAAASASASGAAPTVAMARDPALSTDDLMATLNDIHTYLLQWLGEKQDLASLKLLREPETQGEAQDRVLGALASAYEKIFQALADPANHYPPSAVKSIQHSPEYIKDLFKTITAK